MVRDSSGIIGLVCIYISHMQICIHIYIYILSPSMFNMRYFFQMFHGDEVHHRNLSDPRFSNRRS